MQLAPHFSLAEFVASDIAAAHGIDNSMPPELLDQARDTAAMLERIRAHLSSLAGRDIPIGLSSGYRCLQLNRAVGSSDTSDHRAAMAADWRAPAFGTPYAICQALAPHVDVLGIGQLIHEAPGTGRVWVHTSTRIPSKPINRVITIGPDKVTLAGIQRL